MTLQQNDFQNSSKMIMQAAEQEVLPYDAEVEWLQGDGNAYIQTSIYGSEDLDFEIGYVPYSPATSRNAMTAFGSRADWNVRPYQLSEYKESAPYDGHFAFNTQTHRNSPSLKMVHDVMCIISKHGTSLKAADGTTYSLASHYKTFSTPSPMTIFCLRQNNSIMEKTKGKICYLRFSKNDKMIADFIPVRVGNVGYMYDKVSKQLFGNAGTGSFILGQDVR